MKATVKTAAICCIICLSLLFAGCTKYKQLEPDDGDLTVVGQVEGIDVYLDELRFAIYTCKAQMVDAYGEDIFTGAEAERYRAMLKDMVYANITANYAVILLCEEVGIGMGESAVVEKVDEQMQALVDELGSLGKYKKYLKENNLTDRLLRTSSELSIMKNELMYVYIDNIALIEDDDTKLFDIIEDEFIKVRHVFLPHSEADTMAEVTSALSGGTDMGTLIEQYGRDSDMTASGKFILHGYMSEEYEEAAFKLKTGQISEVVSDSLGVYVIEKLEMTTIDIMIDFNNLKELYQTYTFYDIIDQKQAELTFVPNQAAEELFAELEW